MSLLRTFGQVGPSFRENGTCKRAIRLERPSQWWHNDGRHDHEFGHPTNRCHVWLGRQYNVFPHITCKDREPVWRSVAYQLIVVAAQKKAFKGYFGLKILDHATCQENLDNAAKQNMENQKWDIENHRSRVRHVSQGAQARKTQDLAHQANDKKKSRQARHTLPRWWHGVIEIVWISLQQIENRSVVTFWAWPSWFTPTSRFTTSAASNIPHQCWVPHFRHATP
jgi:hypothetical protein